MASHSCRPCLQPQAQLQGPCSTALQGRSLLWSLFLLFSLLQWLGPGGQVTRRPGLVPIPNTFLSRWTPEPAPGSWDRMSWLQSHQARVIVGSRTGEVGAGRPLCGPQIFQHGLSYEEQEWSHQSLRRAPVTANWMACDQVWTLTLSP